MQTNEPRPEWRAKGSICRSSPLAACLRKGTIDARPATVLRDERQGEVHHHAVINVEPADVAIWAQAI